MKQLIPEDIHPDHFIALLYPLGLGLGAKAYLQLAGKHIDRLMVNPVAARNVIHVLHYSYMEPFVRGMITKGANPRTNPLDTPQAHLNFLTYNLRTVLNTATGEDRKALSIVIKDITALQPLFNKHGRYKLDSLPDVAIRKDGWTDGNAASLQFIGIITQRLMKLLPDGAEVRYKRLDDDSVAITVTVRTEAGAEFITSYLQDNLIHYTSGSFQLMELSDYIIETLYAALFLAMPHEHVKIDTEMYRDYSDHPAFQEGQLAYDKGRSVNSNPHPDTHPFYLLWRHGWVAAYTSHYMAEIQ